MLPHPPLHFYNQHNTNQLNLYSAIRRQSLPRHAPCTSPYFTSIVPASVLLRPLPISLLSTLYRRTAEAGDSATPSARARFTLNSKNTDPTVEPSRTLSLCQLLCPYFHLPRDVYLEVAEKIVPVLPYLENHPERKCHDVSSRASSHSCTRLPPTLVNVGFVLAKWVAARVAVAGYISGIIPQSLLEPDPSHPVLDPADAQCLRTFLAKYMSVTTATVEGETHPTITLQRTHDNIQLSPPAVPTHILSIPPAPPTHFIPSWSAAPTQPPFYIAPAICHIYTFKIYSRTTRSH